MNQQNPQLPKEADVRVVFGLIAFFVLPTMFILLVRNGVGWGEAYGFYLSIAVLAVPAIGMLTWVILQIARKMPFLCISPPRLNDEWAILAGMVAIVGGGVVWALWGFEMFCIAFWPLGFLAMFCIHGINWAIHLVKHHRLI